MSSVTMLKHKIFYKRCLVIFNKSCLKHMKLSVQDYQLSGGGGYIIVDIKPVLSTTGGRGRYSLVYIPQVLPTTRRRSVHYSVVSIHCILKKNYII